MMLLKENPDAYFFPRLYLHAPKWWSEQHPDDIVLFQVGDFFEIYGEDAKQAAELLDLNLTTREIPGAGRVAMCGVPSHNLEMYVEKLRDKYDVTIAEAPDFRGERHIYTLRSIDHEAEAAIDTVAAAAKSRHADIHHAAVVELDAGLSRGDGEHHAAPPDRGRCGRRARWSGVW